MCRCGALRFFGGLLCSALCSSCFLFCSSALPIRSFLSSVCSHSFYSSFLPLSALLFLLSALLDGGGLTLLQKKARFHSSLRKFPPFFQKLHPSSPHLTPHILRTVLHLAPPSPHLNKIGKKSPRSLASVDELPLIFLEFSFAVSKIMIIFVV